MNVRHPFVRVAAFAVIAVLVAFSAAANQLVSVNAVREPHIHDVHSLGAYVIKETGGKTLCRDATPQEAVRINAASSVPLKVFGEDKSPFRTNASAGLNIVLLGTPQLDANPAAKAAFEAAAGIWESRIANPITVYVKVDFGPTRFGEPWSENTIASASSDYRETSFPNVRPKLVARADNGSESDIYSKLPANAVPTDLGSATVMLSPSILLRALGILPANATPSDADMPSIGFNDAFPYDFDPSNGISPGTKDFEGVVVHEVGHMLGFVSLSGAVDQGILDIPVPTVLDLFRFRPGVASGTFTNAQRIMSAGGEQVYFAGGSSLAMSTGQPNGEGGDGRQASHWKDDELSGTRIGIMDPTLGSGIRSELTNNDINAFGVIGYNMVAPNTGGGPAAPSNLTATGISSSQIRLNWTDNSNNETEFRIEQKSGASFVDLGGVAANSTQVTVSGLSAGQTATFRVKARNGSGDSGYTNEATGTTTGGSSGPCTPSSTVVCLLSNRFRVKIDYVNPFSNPPNQPGTFLTARLLSGVQNPDTALFGFSSPQAVEVVVRLQDTRPFANRFDVYYGGMTDVGYTVSVTDTVTGTSRTYTNNVGTVGGGVDRGSFPASALGAPDRLLNSGGTDSFPAEPLPALKPGELLGLSELARGQKLPSAILEALTSNDHFEQRAQKSLAAATSAGGGGACAEVEPNDNALLADNLTLGTPCSGSANVADSYQYTVQYNNAPAGKIHDVFKFVTVASGPATATLNFTNASADLDLILFTISGSTPSIVNASTGSTTTESINVPSLPAGTYYLGVSAYSGGSSYTVVANGSGASAPAAPSNLTATPLSSSQIRLNWTDNSTNETEFRIEQKVSGSFVNIGTTSAPNITQATITGLSAGQTATFRVKARNASGDSAPSNEATATTTGGGSPGPCVPSSTVVCLLNDRFRVKIDYVNPFSNPPNQPGTFLTARLLQGSQNPDTALFGFSSAQAVEVVVRVQDTRPFANRFDIYYGGMTDVGYTVSVTDTQTGASKTYTNPVGKVGGGVDRSSFPAN